MVQQTPGVTAVNIICIFPFHQHYTRANYVLTSSLEIQARGIHYTNPG